ncbi:MAG: hypothetical protein K6F84_01065 [Lachnospiraceae bacterium]|nr:hypothetical protein [Lachnospiraceae bacterium]
MKPIINRIISIGLVIIIVILAKCLASTLLSGGYIPFTQEYDHSMFLKQYNKCDEDFDLLISEFSIHLSDIPVTMYDEGEQIRCERHENNWKIIIFRENERLYEYSIPIDNVKSVETIDSYFKEPLMGITYTKKEKSYIFNIGEYYRIHISEEGVTVD